VGVEGSRLYNPGWHLALDLKSMLTVSEAVALSALAREESRGAHSRIDFPNVDSVWGARNNIIQREGEAMRLRQEKVPEMPGDLRSLLGDEKGGTAHGR
jgi:succinate dehydrogenase / fumarate reductase flavoprotein subunit